MIRDYKDNPIMQSLCREYRANNQIEPEMYKRYRVKRGLRNADGTGVMAGLTRICNVHGYLIDDGEKIPDEGRLTYRGYDINDIVNGCIRENRFGFEEVVWLLLFGRLPTRDQLDSFGRLLYENRELPEAFALGLAAATASCMTREPAVFARNEADHLYEQTEIERMDSYAGRDHCH